MATKRTLTTPDISTLTNGDVFRMGSISESNVSAIYPGSGLTSESSTWFFVQSVDGEIWEQIAGTDFTGEDGTQGSLSFTCNYPLIGVQLNLKNGETTGSLSITLVAK